MVDFSESININLSSYNLGYNDLLSICFKIRIYVLLHQFLHKFLILHKTDQVVFNSLMC